MKSAQEWVREFLGREGDKGWLRQLHPEDPRLLGIQEIQRDAVESAVKMTIDWLWTRNFTMDESTSGRLIEMVMLAGRKKE